MSREHNLCNAIILLLLALRSAGSLAARASERLRLFFFPSFAREIRIAKFTTMAAETAERPVK